VDRNIVSSCGFLAAATNARVIALPKETNTDSMFAPGPQVDEGYEPDR
jgi:hypothetical protein